MKYHELYEKLKSDYLGKEAAAIPKKFWSQFVNVGGASEFQYQLGEFVPKEKKKVLIVGPSGGRDYFYLKLRGHELWALELFEDSSYDNLIIGNIEDEGVLPENTFDVVVMSGVIEHLTQDYKAVCNIRKSLKDDGIFVLGTICNQIFFHYQMGKEAGAHVQIYAPATLELLLSAAGFKVDAMAHNPSLFRYPKLINFPHHFLNGVWYVLTGKTFYRKSLPILWELDYFFATKYSFFRTFSINRYIVLVQCTKSGIYDYVDFNRQEYSKGHNRPSM